MNREIQYDNIAKDRVMQGIDAVADIVKTTIGPSGRNVLVRIDNLPPLITNDGVTIAKSINLKDKAEDAGAQLIIQAANKTNDVAGDGTTTTTILSQKMIHNYIDYVKNIPNVNPVQIQHEMVNGANKISDALLQITTPVESNDDIKRVATISSGSEEIGELISKAFESAGEYGVVITETSRAGIDGLRTINGMKLTNGIINPYLFSDLVKRKTDLVDVDILITRDKLDSASDVLPLLDDCNTTGRKLLILCEDCVDEIVSTIVMNKQMYGANLNICIVKIPGYGDIKDSIVDDICIATGATKMGREYGLPIKEYKPEYLGQLHQIEVTTDECILKFVDTNKEGISLANRRYDRVIELTQLYEEAKPEERQAYEKRIANLSNGISVIEVGGNSDVEIQDKKLRIEDAINSVLSAKEEGVVAGGGYSFLQMYMKFMNLDNKEPIPIGEYIVLDALTEITKQIAENAGYNGEEVVNNCTDKKLGFNALTGQYEDLLKTGVINSVKVDRYSLINAASVASTVITMGGLIVDSEDVVNNK